MLDFVSIKAELDDAGTDLHKIEGIYARVHAEIEAAPADKRAALEAKLTICAMNKRRVRSRRLMLTPTLQKPSSSGLNKKKPTQPLVTPRCLARKASFS